MKSGKWFGSLAADYGNDDGHYVAFSPIARFHSSQVAGFSFGSSISALPSETRLMHVCRLDAGREGQICPYITTVLWLSLSPEVLMQIKWGSTPDRALAATALPSSPFAIVNSYCRI